MEIEAVRKAYKQLLEEVQEQPGQDTYTLTFPQATVDQAVALREAAKHMRMQLNIGVTLVLAGVTYRI
jgi:hypothetical protein